MLLYTSGTTSKPKGVVTTHANINAQITTLITAWEWTPDDRILLVLPLHHVHGIINVLSCALYAGATCYILPRFDAEATWHASIRRWQAHPLHGRPHHLHPPHRRLGLPQRRYAKTN